MGQEQRPFPQYRFRMERMLLDSLYELICRILERPELYIGRPSLERLYAFICGFLYQNSAVETGCLDGFNEYIAKCYGIQSDHNWASIIQFFSNGEESAFACFKEHFYKFNSIRSEK